MMTLTALLLLAQLNAPAMPAGPPVTIPLPHGVHPSFGPPDDKVLLRSSLFCHKMNPGPAEAKATCALYDDQILARAKDPKAKQPIKDRAKELSN